MTTLGPCLVEGALGANQVSAVRGAPPALSRRRLHRRRRHCHRRSQRRQRRNRRSRRCSSRYRCLWPANSSLRPNRHQRVAVGLDRAASRRPHSAVRLPQPASCRALRLPWSYCRARMFPLRKPSRTLRNSCAGARRESRYATVVKRHGFVARARLPLSPGRARTTDVSEGVCMRQTNRQSTN